MVPSESDRPTSATEPHLVPAGKGQAVWALGVRVTVKADSRATGGGYAVVEDLVGPGRGPPLHTHTREDETLYVLAGEVEVVLGDQRHRARPGDFVHMPRGVPHGFEGVGAGPARVLTVFTPGGFEQWFLDIGRPAADPDTEPPDVTPEDARKAAEVAAGYGVTYARK